MKPPPLNGEKTHPLSEHATMKLRELSIAPQPTLLINPGVVNRFLRDELAEIVQLPSPYKSHAGRNTNFMQITQIGLDYLARRDGG